MLARVVAFCLVHFAGTVTLAKIERAIISQITARATAARTGQPSRAQKWMPAFVTRWRIRRATRSLHRRLDAWQRDGRRK